MARSVKKGPFIAGKLYQRILDASKTGEKRMIRTYSRTSTIIPEMVGMTISVVQRQDLDPGCMSPRIWSGTSSVNLHRRACSAAMPGRIARRCGGDRRGKGPYRPRAVHQDVAAQGASDRRHGAAQTVRRSPGAVGCAAQQGRQGAAQGGQVGRRQRLVQKRISTRRRST